MDAHDSNAPSTDAADDAHGADLLDAAENAPPLTPLGVIGRVVGLLLMLYVFLVGINVMGDAFKLIGGGTAGEMFQAIRHPIAGLMVGMIATALVQSSSTTTSIIVGLVAGGAIDVGTAVPMIMGANIGTSVTNTIVSMGHAGNREEFKRAFAGATVHDFFNILAVLTLLPLEIAFGVIQKLSATLTTFLLGGPDATFSSPLKAILKPAVKFFVEVDKSKIKAAAKGDAIDGSLLKGGIFEGMGWADGTVGVMLAVGAALMTIVALTGIVKLMKALMEARASTYLKRALEANAAVSMLIGALVTIMVQSSSITTSTLVPLVGIGLITLEAMFPLTLGANIGTTITALIAAMANSGDGASAGLQIALCHLLFNILGIALWYPIPQLRNLPLAMARKLGELVARWRPAALAYIAIVFFLLPAGVLALDKLLAG